MTRFLVLYQKRKGELVANPRDCLRSAPSITKALQGDPPRDELFDRAWVVNLDNGDITTVPIHHRSSSWGPSSEWGRLGG